jgi:hypothetical protein
MKATALIAPIVIVVLLILTFSQIVCPAPVFAANQFTITAIQSANGTISPNSATVNQGGSKSFNINPAVGYSIASLIVDGSYLTVASSYTFSNVQADHIITATFAIMNFTLTVTQNVNGNISPGTTNVTYRASQTFSITPNTGYSIASLTVDGSSVQSMSSYTFNNVKDSHSISATFALTSPSTPTIAPITTLITAPTTTTTTTPTTTPGPTTPLTSTASPKPYANNPTPTAISIVPSTSIPTPTSTSTSTKTALSESTNFGFLNWLLLLLVIPFGALAFGIVAIKRRKKKQDPKNPAVKLPNSNKPKDPEGSIDHLFNKTEESIDNLFNKILETEEHKIENDDIPDYEKSELLKKKYVKVARARQILEE